MVKFLVSDSEFVMVVVDDLSLSMKTLVRHLCDAAGAALYWEGDPRVSSDPESWDPENYEEGDSLWDLRGKTLEQVLEEILVILSLDPESVGEAPGSDPMGDHHRRNE